MATRSAPQPSGDEGEHLRGGPVQPLGVVDEADHWPVVGMLGQLLRRARPTKKRSGGRPGLRPNAVSSASRCGAGSRSRPSRSGCENWCTAAKGSSISDSIPTTRTTWQSVLPERRSRAARSCRCRPRRGGPAHGSPPPGQPADGRRARRTHECGRAGLPGLSAVTSATPCRHPPTGRQPSIDPPRQDFPDVRRCPGVDQCSTGREAHAPHRMVGD